MITPHGTKPNENELTPNEINFLQAGIYNLGFMAVEKTDETVALLQWWARRLERLCINDQRNGIFVDQKWIDLWPAYCEGVKVLRDPAYNVAYWNLDQRTLSLVSDRFVVDDAPLVFFHFSGLVPGIAASFPSIKVDCNRIIVLRFSPSLTTTMIGLNGTVSRSFLVAPTALDTLTMVPPSPTPPAASSGSVWNRIRAIHSRISRRC